MPEDTGPRMDELIGRTDWFDPALPQSEFEAFVDCIGKDVTNSVRMEQLARMCKNMRATVAQWNTAYESDAADVDLGEEE